MLPTVVRFFAITYQFHGDNDYDKVIEEHLYSLRMHYQNLKANVSNGSDIPRMIWGCYKYYYVADFRVKSVIYEALMQIYEGFNFYLTFLISINLKSSSRFASNQLKHISSSLSPIALSSDPFSTHLSSSGKLDFPLIWYSVLLVFTPLHSSSYTMCYNLCITFNSVA